MVRRRPNDDARVEGTDGSRFYSDERSVRWEVFEVEKDGDGAPSLIFDSASAFRRVRKYDSHWRELSDIDLGRLSRGT